jgi:hypothetical protein
VAKKTHHIKVAPATFTLTGLSCLNYAHRYLRAANTLDRDSNKAPYDPVQFHLLCQSLELSLKAFIWLIDGLSWDQLKKTYGHNLEKLWRDSKSKGIRKYCKTTSLRDEVIGSVGPAYKTRKFVYADISVLVDVVPKLRNNKAALTCLRKLCQQLQKSLKDPVQKAT